MFATGFAPYAASENLVNSKLALAFLQEGWQIDVISQTDEGFMYSADWRDPWLSLKPITHEVRYEVGGSVARTLDAIRQSLRVHYPIGGLRWAGRAFDLSLKLHKERNYRVILSRSPNDVGHLPAMMLARRTGLPWIANCNDPPSPLWPRPYDNKLGTLKKYVHGRFARQVFRSATICTFPSERLRTHVLRAVGREGTGDAAVVPHVGLGDIHFSGPVRDGRFKLCHAGNLSRERHPRALFEAMSRFVKECGARASLQFSVMGVDDVGMERMAREYGLERNVLLTGSRPYEEALRQLAENDVLVVLEAPCDEGIFFPSKVVDYVQVGRPILAVSPEDGTVADLLSRYGGGLAADCTSPEKICQALTDLYASWRDGKLQEKHGSRHLYAMFSPDTIVTAYEKLFERVGVMA